MFLLDDDEKLEIAKRVVERANGKLPVIATGTFTENIDEQSEFIKRIYDTGVDSVICLANFLAKEGESDKAWKKNAETLLNKTEGIPFGIYECPLPYHRLLEVETVEWAAKTERFFWMKETSEHINKIKAKTEATKNSNLSLYNAHTASLLESLRYGTIGFSGIAANFYPSLFSWMVDNFDEEIIVANELNEFLIESQNIVDHKYITSAKHFLKMKGIIKQTTSRLEEQTFNTEEIEALKSLLQKADQWHKKLGLPVWEENFIAI